MLLQYFIHTHIVPALSPMREACWCQLAKSFCLLDILVLCLWLMLSGKWIVWIQWFSHCVHSSKTIHMPLSQISLSNLSIFLFPDPWQSSWTICYCLWTHLYFLLQATFFSTWSSWPGIPPEALPIGRISIHCCLSRCSLSKVAALTFGLYPQAQPFFFSSITWL